MSWTEAAARAAAARSAARLLVGGRVRHGQHGPGTLLELLPGGRGRVRFDARPGLPRRVPLAELRPAGADEAPPGALEAADAPSPPRPLRPRSPEQLEALALLASLRLGLVPDRGASRYAVATDRMRRALRRWLGEAPAFRIVEGRYGAGKSLTLRCMAEWAEEQGWVVAEASMEPGTSRFPARLWQRVLASLRLPGEAGGLQALLRRLREAAPEALRDPSDPDFSDQLSPLALALTEPALPPERRAAVLAFLRAERQVRREEVRAALRAAGWRGKAPYKFPEHRTSGQLFAHGLSTLACWSRRAGFGGLLVLLDETERVEALTWDDRQYTARTVDHLLLATEHVRSRRKVQAGGHEGLREVSPRLRADQPLVVVAADTTTTTFSNLSPWAFARPTQQDNFRAFLGRHGASLPAEPVPRLDARSIEALARRLAAIYAEAHPDLEHDERALAALARSALRDAEREARQYVDADPSVPREVVRRLLRALDERLLARRGEGSADRRRP